MDSGGGQEDAVAAGNFADRYAVLNGGQRLAVDTVYGPVMVIAGPGTGKTEVLAMRIAALLRSDAGVQPQEILCLTYSDEAANAMRRRLVAIIGPAAHRVTISTFHAFCNSIIQQNAAYFSSRPLQPVTELEKADLLRELIDELPEGHPLRRYGAAYYDLPALDSLFTFMKQEALMPEAIFAAVEAHVHALAEDPAYRYARSQGQAAAGDLKQELYDAEVVRMERTRAAAALYPAYLRKMSAAGRYDFADMILWVISAFRDHPDLLMRAREQYRFLLVDEFQDTNGAQLSLLHALTGQEERPNIFVVGDDDQSIYGFQGARLRNITDFYERYREVISVIVLTHNYRSSQAVLDVARASIGQNTQRLIHAPGLAGVSKDLLAAHPRFAGGADTVAPVVHVFATPLAEEAWVVHRVEELSATGVDLSTVAVIYAQHRQAEGLVRMFERRGIPFTTRRPVNVLGVPEVQTVIAILRYIRQERGKPFSGEADLFRWMHAPALGLKPGDIGTMALYLQGREARERGQKYYRQLLDNPLQLQALGLEDVAAAARLGTLISRWISNSAGWPVTLLTESILQESGIVRSLLTRPPAEMQTLHTFFRFVRDTAIARPRLTLDDLVSVLERMEEEGLALRQDPMPGFAEGVQLLTAHGAKGQEFEYVFLIGANRNYWEGKRPVNGFKMPANLTQAQADAPGADTEEGARRLFYVALTRAKQFLSVSYAEAGADGKAAVPSLFVDELSAPSARIRPLPDSAEMLAYLADSMQPVPPAQIAVAQGRWIDQMLKQINLSPSTLSNFLRCPLAWYYECLLRVPVQQASYFAFGSAVHAALEAAFEQLRQDRIPAPETLTAAFERAMARERGSMPEAEFRRRMEQGVLLLRDYYQERLPGLHRHVEIEYRTGRVMLDGRIPITGRIDKIELYEDGCVVVDYKTGKPGNAAKKISSPNEEEPNGGDYWRQMVFYKILLENQPDRQWQVKHGVFDLVEKNDRGAYEPRTVLMTPADVTTVKAQIRDAWSRIRNHEFDTGCGKAECAWCSFVRKNGLVRPSAPDSALSDPDD